MTFTITITLNYSDGSSREVTHSDICEDEVYDYIADIVQAKMLGAISSFVVVVA